MSDVYEWLMEPRNETAIQGSTVLIDCEVDGLTEDDVMVWSSRKTDKTLFHNLLEIKNVPQRYSVQPSTSGFSLVISQLRLEDAGEYVCSVSGWQQKSMFLSLNGEHISQTSMPGL